MNGAIALYTLERDIRMAGYGINHSAALGCTCEGGTDCSPVQYYYNGVYSSPPRTAGGALPPLEFAPVVISETPDLPDTITVLYGNDPERMLPGKLTESCRSPRRNSRWMAPPGYTDQRPAYSSPTVARCMRTQVTHVQDAASPPAAQPGTVVVEPGRRRQPLPGFPAGANLFNLGNPIWRTYSIDSAATKSKLQFQEVVTTGGPTTAATAVPIIDDIVDLQAQYGKDTDDNGMVETLEHRDADERCAMAAGACRARDRSGAQRELRASERRRRPVRSDHQRHPAAMGRRAAHCSDFPTLMVAGALPSCYKYRVFETIIPLRNMIWRPA